MTPESRPGEGRLPEVAPVHSTKQTQPRANLDPTGRAAYALAMTIFKSITGGSELPQLPTFIPECMTAMELATWEAYNRRCGRNAAVRACADCLLGFAADMRALGKCNGTPGGADEDDPE